jgi:hypothetical protein
MEQFLNYLWAILIAYVWNQAHERHCLQALASERRGTDSQWAEWNHKRVTKLSLVTS